MSSTAPSTQLDRAKAIWQSCIDSAFRTALACAVVGVVTVYGPPILTNQVTLPAFSYVTIILIITDATLGDTIQGCWLALYATVQSICPAILSLWLIGPARLTNFTTSLLVAVAGFVVVLPESTHLMAKKIALGQVVLTYVIAFIHGGETEPVRHHIHVATASSALGVMHPIHVAASTALGVFACVLALVLPFPRLACSKVKQNIGLYEENACERLKLYVKAFGAVDKTSANASISQAKLLATNGTKFLHSIKAKQESMEWERLPFNCLGSYYPKLSNKIHDLEIPLRGMEMAISSIPSFSITSHNDNLKTVVEQHLNVSLKQVKKWIICDHTNAVADDDDSTNKSFQALQATPDTLPSMFFIFCVRLLHRESIPTAQPPSPQQKNKEHDTKLWNRVLTMITRSLPKQERLRPAFKSALSLGLACLLGLMYSKKDGFWAGLPVAITLAAGREAVFKASNLKAQGTVLGTVYGVIGCFLFQKYFQLRLLSLLPWFIFTNFLRRSKMYAQAGGLSAIIGAVLVLGRNNYGPPSEFAIARIVETFIGLISAILVDIVMQTSRAAPLAKTQLAKCLGALSECIESINFISSQSISEQNHKRLQLKASVLELGKYVSEAEVEPNFWFLPFHNGCYNKLLASLTKTVDLFLFGSLAITFLEQESQKVDEDITYDLKLFKEKLSCFVTCLNEVALVNSIKVLENELGKNKISHDVEMGKSSHFGFTDSEQDEMEKIMDSYWEHLKDVECGENEEMKMEIVTNLSAFGFCMNGLVKEAREIRKGLEELVQWENPTTPINLYEISCKGRTLRELVYLHTTIHTGIYMAENYLKHMPV